MKKVCCSEFLILQEVNHYLITLLAIWTDRQQTMHLLMTKVETGAERKGIKATIVMEDITILPTIILNHKEDSKDWAYFYDLDTVTSFATSTLAVVYNHGKQI